MVFPILWCRLRSLYCFFGGTGANVTIQSAERGAADLAGTLGRMLQLHPDRVNPASLWTLSTHREQITCRPRQLLVRTERENGDRVRMVVRDTAIGVDRQSMDKLFDAFYTTNTRCYFLLFHSLRSRKRQQRSTRAPHGLSD